MKKQIETDNSVKTLAYDSYINSDKQGGGESYYFDEDNSLQLSPFATNCILLNRGFDFSDN